MTNSNRIDMSRISDDARTKSIAKIRHDKDSLVQVFDSVGNAYYQDARQVLYPVLQLKKSDLVKAKTLASTKKL